MWEHRRLAHPLTRSPLLDAGALDLHDSEPPPASTPFRVRLRWFSILLGAWLALVAARFAARGFGVGAGARGMLGLAEVTAVVNVFWLGAAPAAFALSGRIRRLQHRPVQIALWSAIGAVVCVLETLWYLGVLRAFHGQPDAFLAALASRADVNLVVYGLILTAIALQHRVMLVGRGLRIEHTLERMLVEAELSALHLQLQPHFLYNTLQLVAEAAYSDQDQSHRILADLRRLLQRSFSYEQKRFVTVREEIDFLRAYADIQRERFGRHLTLTIVADEDTNDLLVPPLLLQPLVENSIRHGIGGRSHPGHVDVVVRRSGDLLRLIISDDGVGFGTRPDSRRGGGLGLSLTRRRLAFLYGAGHTFAVGNADDCGAVITIDVPATQVPSSPPAEHLASAPARVVDRTLLLQLAAGWGCLLVALPVIANRASAPAMAISVTQRDQLVSLPIWAIITCAALVMGRLSSVAGKRLVLAHGVVITSCIALHVMLVPWIALHAFHADLGGSSRFVIWAPWDGLMYALVVSLVRIRDVAGQLRSTDLHSKQLRENVNRNRERIALLHLGKRLMVAALDALTVPREASEYDTIVLRSSEIIRSALAAANDGWSTVELEMELVRDLLSLHQPHPGPAGRGEPLLRVDVDERVSHTAIPPGALASLIAAMIDEGAIPPSAVRVTSRPVNERVGVFLSIVPTQPYTDTLVLDRIRARAEELVSYVSQLYGGVCTFDVDIRRGALCGDLTVPRVANADSVITASTPEELI